MKGVGSLLILLLSMISCAGLPGPEPINSLGTSGTPSECSIPFVSNRWQFIHSIEGTLPNGRKTCVIGITDISPDMETLHCVIMTLEGLVVFEGRSENRGIVIDRGLPPFDSEDFAGGLMKDLRLLFFKPDGKLIDSGTLGNGSTVYRYKNDNGILVDVITHQDRTWEIRQYENERLIRSIKAGVNRPESSVNQGGIPARIDFFAYGPATYTLLLDLIRAEPLYK